jgi:hypothetical protein
MGILKLDRDRSHRTLESLCDAEIEANRIGPTRWNTAEVVQRTKRRFRIRNTRCLYHQLTTALRVPELTPVVRQIDDVGFNSYFPGKVVFSRDDRNHRIADGAKECDFTGQVVD